MRLSPGDFVDFRRESRSFEGLAAIRNASMSLTGGGDPEQVRVNSVSGNFLTLLGARAIAGRTFLPADDEQGQWDRVMLSEGLWKRRYGGRADIVGATVTLAGTPMEVVGVLPASFRFERPADVWLLGRRGIPRSGSVPGDLTTNRDVHILQVIGKLAPGVPLPVAQAELDAHAARLARQFPQTNTGYGVLLDPLQVALVGDTRPVLAVLLGAVTVLLLIAAANVANLMLVRARAAHRGTDVAERARRVARPPPRPDSRRGRLLAGDRRRARRRAGRLGCERAGRPRATGSAAARRGRRRHARAGVRFRAHADHRLRLRVVARLARVPRERRAAATADRGG